MRAAHNGEDVIRCAQSAQDELENALSQVSSKNGRLRHDRTVDITNEMYFYYTRCASRQGHHREQSSLHAVVSARGTKHHPHQEVLNEAGSRFTIHQTCEQSTIRGSSAMTSIASATYQVPPLQGRDTWIRSFPQGRVCEFAIYSDGRVEIL